MNNSKLDSISKLDIKRVKRRPRDLSAAVTLRPSEIYALYGIPTSTLSEYCNDPDKSKRLPSLLVPGRCGRKGARYVKQADLKFWLDRWQVAA